LANLVDWTISWSVAPSDLAKRHSPAHVHALNEGDQWAGAKVVPAARFSPSILTQSLWSASGELLALCGMWCM
jgi:hypothetical protein